MPKLFARYVSGQIDDMPWSNLMDAIDADALSSQERMAMAEFFSDALEEFGPDAMSIPKLDEMQDLLTQTRAA